ncbi:related to URB1 - nucleolar protein required for the normal accumulation of 25S and 5.8S rRNAs [Melanopsichium pennsylvanicum]|uniref:Related to URB1 - nucleolar protein required for the normal accumulation of 25S and 5.8S rRNAs n=2 Tax=Melanopsichium pennsylvanicum TaxID=63383 RepID=A0AAJ4XNU9_9BASI|nr:conserved hypothetical protein [Melanopsichium pennsylvanicum 4]SNX86060.1 related to URB1 - nucleolar protein required for the normal accumulation of 25S and 5.8S rRNAs [Melanopsichium pennsylvanicum]
MVDKRKRAGSDAASVRRSSDPSEDDRTAVDQPTAQEPVQNKTLIPFADGAELYEALKTPSADLLRLLLSRLRNQTSLSFAENTERSTIPASDKRIQLVKDYCQLCETQASNSDARISAAASIFSTWELADRQDLPTLLHLPIFCLAQSLALLSIHYPTHASGFSIIERVLSPNEPWLAFMHKYISNLGSAKFASRHQESRSAKGSDVAALASLVLFRELTTFAKGRYAAKVFDSFNWSMKVLPHIFNMRRRINWKSKTSKKAHAAQDVSLRRPDIRTLYILFLLSFLQQSYSLTLKLRLLDLGKEFLPGILKGLPQDPPDVVQTVLLHLHEDLVKDQKIPRSKKVEFWNEWACGCVVQLYSREEEHVLIHADTDSVENPSVAELAHHFLLSICTNPGFGICYPDRGWYPRKATNRNNTNDDVGQVRDGDRVDGIVDSGFAAETHQSQKGKHTGGPIYNKVLSGVIRQLAVAEDLRQQELALSILTACPELVGPYLESSCAGLSVDPRPSSRWLCNVAVFGRVIGLELPSFRIAKVEHLETPDAPALTPQSHRLFASEPPPMSSILANILPGPLHRFLFSQGLNSGDRLVRYSTCTLLCRCLNRMLRFRNICLSAITELDEGEDGPWRRRLDALELEARRRIPDISIVIQILQVATSRPGSNGTSEVQENTIADAVSEKDNMLSTEVALRLLSLYYQAVPTSAFDVRFNAGKLLTNAFISASASAKPHAPDEDVETTSRDGAAPEMQSDNVDPDGSDSEQDDDGDSGEISLEALCQVHTLRILSQTSRAASFDWTAKPSGTGNNLSYLGLLLSLFTSTPFQQVKGACEDLLRSLLSFSSFFEHSPPEIDAWLANLPQSDTRSTQIGGEGGQAADAGVTPHQLSDEQQVVVAFLDECMLRCAKTPYRYIEAAREFLQENGLHSNRNDDGSEGRSSSADLLASPWLMAVFEQFTIRVEKSLFLTDAGTVDALTSFFVRLLPSLCAYTRHTSGLEVMASKINDCIKSNQKYVSSAFLASTLISKINSIRVAPNSKASASPKKTKQTSSASKLFNGFSSPADLKTRLRTVERPLTQAQVSELYAIVQHLHTTGFVSVSQIFEELDPVTENIAHAVYQGSDQVVVGSIPILHLPLSAKLVVATPDDFMMSEEAKEESTLVPWNSNDQVRLAIWIAVNRAKSKQNDGDATEDGKFLAHITSLIFMADMSGFLTEEDAKQYLFAEAASQVEYNDGETRYTAGLLRQISDLAIKRLDIRRNDHRQIARTIINKLDRDEDFSADWYTALTNLVPFMEETGAAEAMDTCNRVFGEADPPIQVAFLAAKLLRTLAAVFRPPSHLWTAFPIRLQTVVDEAAKFEPLEVGDADHEVARELSDLLFGHIQSVLQDAQHSGDSSVQKALSELNVSQLAKSGSHSPAKDGALVAAIHAHPSLAFSVSRSITSILSSNEGLMIEGLPCTMMIILSALLEGQVAQIAGEIWTENFMTPVVNSTTSSILGTSDCSAGSIQKQTAVLVLTMRCALKFGWSTIQKNVSGQLMKFVSGALHTAPSKAFRAPLIELLLGMVEEAPGVSGLPDVVQATVDASLLWLVRRFAEDTNDSVDLVRTITLFTSLIERVGKSNLEVQLNKSLIDPVIQAAIKNRLLALNQMHLVLALCAHSVLDSTQLSRYLGALSAHSDLGSVMRANASVLQPLPDERDGDEERDPDAEEEKREKSQRLKQLTVELLYTIASRDAKELLRAPLLTKLMGFYGATLAKEDRMLMKLFRMFEEECGQPFGGLIQQWTLPSSQQGASGDRETTLEALQSLDANVVFATCTEFPRSLSLRNTINSGYQIVREDLLLGQVYGKRTDPAHRYDPVFLFSLLAGVTADGVKLTGLQWLSVLSTNVPSLVVCGLSSRCPDMRAASLTLISNLYLAIREADFQERDHMVMILDLLRDALDSSIAIQDDSTTPTSAPFLPTTTTLFIAHALRSVTTPSSFIYPVISHFLLQRPELDVSDVPLLYNLLYTASDKYKQERMWMLRFLRDVARSGGRSDWKIFKRRRTWELLASLYDACDTSGAGVSVEKAVEDTAIRALVEDTTAWLARSPDVAIELITRRGLLAWIWQQVVKEGVMALADRKSSNGQEKKQKDDGTDAIQPAGTLRSVWMLLLAQLLRSVDLDRLHRATDSAWIPTTLNLTFTTIRALHNCQSSPSNPTLPIVSSDLVRTVTCAAAVVLEKVLLFSEDPALALRAQMVVGMLEKMLDLAQALETGGKEMEECLVRIQQCLLLVAAGVADAKTGKVLARLIRRSTALCRLFDTETASLVVSNLFTPTA